MRMQHVVTVVSKPAAIFLFAAPSFYLAFHYTFGEKTGEMEFAYHESRTAPGEKASIRLMDGSEASINADSGLSVPNLFHEERREVMLDEIGRASCRAREIKCVRKGVTKRKMTEKQT